MRNKFFIRCAAVCIAALMVLTPVNASAATLLKRGSTGNEVITVQKTLKELGYYTYSKTTGYYGSVTVAAVKRFQKANGIAADGILGKRTLGLLNAKTEAKAEVKTDEKAAIKTMSVEAVSGAAISVEAVSGSAVTETLNTDPDHSGALDWFKEVRYIWDRGEIATVTDVETGLSFHVKRTYGTNHADVEPLTKEDTAVIKEIWGGFNWERKAVVVEIDGYTIAASMTAMPHAGVDSRPADQYVSNRSAGYGRGYNLDKIKDNGCSGVMDIHFKNSRTHSTNTLQQSQQNMVKKAADFIALLS